MALLSSHPPEYALMNIRPFRGHSVGDTRSSSTLNGNYSKHSTDNHRLVDGGPSILGPSSILNQDPSALFGMTIRAENFEKNNGSKNISLRSVISNISLLDHDSFASIKSDFENMLTSSIHVPLMASKPIGPFDPPLPSIQNIVATVDLGQRIDLKKLTLHSRNTEYNPKRFSAVIMRIREPRTTALIFSSGKMVTTGAKSVCASRQASRKFARIVQKVGFDVTFADFKIQNVVGSCDVRFSIQLEGLCITHAHFSTYEPELFPGLIYRMVQPRVVLLIFVSGKVVITGARHQEDIDQAFKHIYPILKTFKK